MTGIDLLSFPMNNSRFLRTRRPVRFAASAARAHAVSLSVAALLAGSRFRRIAQDTAPALAETVVTATRTPTRVDELVSDTVVIDRAQIEQLAQPHAARTAGAHSPACRCRANGGVGKTSSVFIRGTEARHTILLIDGVRYGSATAGTPIWDNIPVEMIDRIEVVKGPASALYGSDGVGGVVQIFTRKGKPGEPVVQPARVGHHRQRRLQADHRRLQRRLGRRSTYSLDVQRTIDKGFSATNRKVQFGNFNPDRDPFSQSAAQLLARLPDQPGLEDRRRPAVLRRPEPLRRRPGPRHARHRAHRRPAYIGARGAVTVELDHAAALFAQRRLHARHRGRAFNLPGLFETTQDQYLWQNDIATPIGTVVRRARAPRAEGRTATPRTR